MELKDLQCFVAIAEELSFTRAALRLRIAQPALSLRLRYFEEALGAQLFARTKRKVALTQAGAALLPLARQVLASADQAVQTVRLVSEGQSGVLRVGAFYSAIYTVLPRIIRQFSSRYPNVEIQIKQAIVSEQIRMLNAGAIDVGILRSERPLPELRAIDLLQEDFLCAMHVEHRLADRRRVSLHDLAEESLIALDPEFNAEFYAATYAAFAAEDLSPHVIKKAPDMHLVLGLVSAGLGVSLVPSSLAQIQHKYVQFRPLKETLPRMTMRLAWHPDTESAIVPRFVAEAMKAIAKGPAKSRSLREKG